MSEQEVDLESARVAAVAADLRVLVGQLRRRLQEKANPGDFTPSQIAVVARLESDGPATVTALAKAEGVRPQSMGATVAVLEAAGIVSGTPDPSDGRRTILAITPAAREALVAGRAKKEDWLFRSIRAALTPAEQEQLAVGVELLHRIVVS
ncbi:MarR family protein [mine drainage metagenome]|uniref:MarR family protein n=1 Tax=mine drainage metagenome TaxID=410659 RepID=A0A1J5QS49_9ZZZZ